MLKATLYGLVLVKTCVCLSGSLTVVEGRANAVETPIGYVPTYDDLNWTGTDFSKEEFDLITAQDKDQWITEIESHTELFTKLGDRLPQALKERQEALLNAVKNH
jgi:phosphoenolpyruvate carboxykinase (GTP)